MATPDPERLLRAALRVIEALGGGGRVDRRKLAADVNGHPHSLDDGRPLSGLVLALLCAGGITDTGLRARRAWECVGVDLDDVTGGLLVVGIAPRGWVVPTGCAVTLPPRTLASCAWPAPDRPESWVFVTENPSVAAACQELVEGGAHPRLLCTSGTPTQVEVESIAGLERVGWRLAVRADFDSAGIRHVGQLLRAAPGAVPWRMMLEDYDQSRREDDWVVDLDRRSLPETFWDARLFERMQETGAAAFEESLLPKLLEDVRTGTCPPPGPGNGRAAEEP
ncbi:MAG: DUF2399 domain-containing protein [Pseudomonadota bacterium]|nr:DUF2399 domain-containing protein [Pseudomonadota bacterium]